MTLDGTPAPELPEGTVPSGTARPQARDGGPAVTWDPAPPRAGRGLDLRWGWIDTPFGDALAVRTDAGLAGLGFAVELGRDAVRTHYMEKLWPQARWREDRAAARAAVDPVRGARRLHLMGTPFRIDVWRELLAIPEGRTSTYGDIARRLGRPKGARAVGGAVGANPVSWFVPCHRVMGSAGELTGFGWGLTVKRAMLARESALPDGDLFPTAR